MAIEYACALLQSIDDVNSKLFVEYLLNSNTNFHLDMEGLKRGRGDDEEEDENIDDQEPLDVEPVNRIDRLVQILFRMGFDADVSRGIVEVR